MLLLDISGSLKAKECDLIVRDKPSGSHDHSSKNGLINGIGSKTVTVSTCSGETLLTVNVNV